MKKETKNLTVFATIMASLLMGNLAIAYTTDWCYSGSGYNCDQCDGINAAYSLACAGSYCSGIRQDCDNQGFFMMNMYWTNYVSEEAPNSVTCDSGYIVGGMDCNGPYCDEVALHCVNIGLGPGFDCNWVGPVSEESPSRISCPGTGYISGVRCEGGYCDNMSIYCCDYDYLD